MCGFFFLLLTTHVFLSCESYKEHRASVKSIVGLEIVVDCKAPVLPQPI